jgi:hypothetical protein
MRLARAQPERQIGRTPPNHRREQWDDSDIAPWGERMAARERKSDRSQADHNAGDSVDLSDILDH